MPNTRSTETDESFLAQIALSYAEFKHDLWRTYEPKPADERRLWAIVYAADWHGTARQRMERLLALAPLAIEQASRLSAFASARTTLWTICRSADGVARLAGGLDPGTSGRGWESSGTDRILRVKLPDEAHAAIHALAAADGITASALVALLIEAHLLHHGPSGAGE